MIIGEITPAGYDFINVPRSTGRRGRGIGILYKSSLQLSVVPSDTTPTTFEHVRVVGKLKDICLTAIYRPPPSQANGFTTRNFLDELEIFIGDASLQNGKSLITGDFNIHIDESEKSEVKQFMTILENAGFTQNVTVPTHRGGHTIDLLLSRPVDHLICDWCVCDKLM